MSKVSIITATYNGERFLREDVDSVLNQTYRDLELVLIDDGSTDRTGDILREYEQRDTRVSVTIHPENQGILSTYLHGVQLSTGDYFKIFDHDDRLHPQCIEKQVEFMDEHPEVGIVFTSTNNMTTDGSVYRTKRYPFPTENGILDKRTLLLYTLFSPIFPFTQGGGLIRRGAFDQIGDYFDTLMVLKFAKSDWGFGYIDEPLFDYRTHDSNASCSLKTRIGFFRYRKRIVDEIVGNKTLAMPIKIYWLGIELSKAVWLRFTDKR